MIYSNQGVCHAWANQHDYNPSNSGGTIYGQGATLYSYGEHFPIAQHVDEVILFTTDSYGPTTARHMSYARHAITMVAIVYYVPNILAETKAQHGENFKDYRKRVSNLIGKASTARANKDWLLTQVDTLTREANNYADHFKLRLKRIDNSDLNLIEIADRLKTARAIERKKKANEQARFIKEQKVNIEAWQSGASKYFPYGVHKVYLRINDDTVETSQRASFPTSHARLAWRVISRCVKHSEAWVANGHTVKLGHYQVNSIAANGDLKAGCHFVTYAESLQIAEKLGLTGVEQ